MCESVAAKSTSGDNPDQGRSLAARDGITVSDMTARTICPSCKRPSATVMGSCSECGASKGETPSFIETQLHRQRARSYSSSSGEWWELWGLDWGMRLAVGAFVGGLGYLLVSLL